MDDTQKPPEHIAPKGFHHVTFRVRRIYAMLMVRDEHQEITATVSMKLEQPEVEELVRLAQDWLKNPVGLFGVTGEGEFRK